MLVWRWPESDLEGSMSACRCWQESELEDCLLERCGQETEHEAYVSVYKDLHGRTGLSSPFVDRLQKWAESSQRLKGVGGIAFASLFVGIFQVIDALTLV